MYRSQKPSAANVKTSLYRAVSSHDLSQVRAHIERGIPASYYKEKLGPNGEGLLATAVREYAASPTSRNQEKIFGLLVRDIRDKKRSGTGVTMFPKDYLMRTAGHELAEHAKNDETYRKIRSMLQSLNRVGTKIGKSWKTATTVAGQYIPINSTNGAHGLHRMGSILLNREMYTLGNENRPKSSGRSALNRRNTSIAASRNTESLNNLLRTMHLNSQTGQARRRNNSPGRSTRRRTNGTPTRRKVTVVRR